MTRREALRFAALLPASGLVLSACGRAERPLIVTGDDDEGDEATFDVRALQRLLDRRAEAQLQGDEEGYLEDLDHSNRELLERERLEFANLRQFDVEHVQFTTDQLRQLMLAPPPAQAGPQRFMPVTKVVKLTADAGPDGVLGPGESFEYVLEQRGGSWVVTDIRRLDHAELERLDAQGAQPAGDMLPANAPWWQDRLTVMNVGNVWLAADDTVDDLEVYAAEAEAEAGRVEKMWGDRPRFPGHVLFFTRDKATFARWYDVGRGSDLTDVRPGYAVPMNGVRGNGKVYAGQYVGARNMIYLPAVEEHDWEPVDTMRHELVHTVTQRAFGTGDSLLGIRPASWAVEGFASFITARGVGRLEQRERALAVSGFAGSLPDTPTFQDGDARTVAANYAVSSMIFRFVEQTLDLATAIEFYAEVVKWNDWSPWGDESYQPFVGKPAFDGLCQQVLGMGATELMQRWGAFVQGGA